MNFLNKHQNQLTLSFLILISSISFMLFYTSAKILTYADTRSRLDIARKVIDNLHPGFTQFGNVWLPLPQMLMLPFIWSSFLWHSGIAGSLMSMPAFILSGYFIYKTSRILTNSPLAAFLGMCIYALNINMLFLQTTAMSESLFLCTISASIYFFVKWINTKNAFELIPAAIAVSAMTYTRYEGLSILFGSIPMVFIISFIMKKKFSHAEGQTLLYSILALTGFGAWSLYLLVIFGDPFYWLHFYAAPSVIQGSVKHAAAVTHVAIISYSQQKTLFSAIWEYFTSFVWMIGIVPTIFCGLGLIVLLIKSVRTKTLYFIPLLLPLAIYAFMVLALRKNTPIVQPDLNIHNILSATTSGMTGFNIRYGILLLPWVAVISSYLFSFRYKIVNLLIFSLFFIQLIPLVYPKYTPIYNITTDSIHTTKAYPIIVKWMKEHYTGGEILISASSHEDQMFEMGFNYRTYIHEGAGKYWKESIDNPSRYATYVILDSGHPDDTLAKYFVHNSHRQGILDRDYNLVFDDRNENIKVYKIKTKPYYIL